MIKSRENLSASRLSTKVQVKKKVFALAVETKV